MERHELVCDKCDNVFGYYDHVYIEKIEDMIPKPIRWTCRNCEFERFLKEGVRKEGGE